MTSRASLLSVSIGPLLLKGWTLTDSPCKNPGCGAPHVRPPNSTQLLCPACDSEIIANSPASGASTSPTEEHVSAATSLSTRSGTSTPLTEDSRSSSPDFHLPADTPEMIARRETTDRASAEIGRRLLQGWAMLGDECPNESCYGTPLMRPPPVSASAGKNPRKECVVCGRAYVSERDAPAVAASASAHVPARDDPVDPPVPAGPIEVAPALQQQQLPSTISTSTTRAAHSSQDNKPSLASLRSAADSLDAALQRTASHLASLSASTGPSLDVRAIGETADAMAKVAEALGKVRELQQQRS
ncbi:hypothetical protein EXIGLDRAFT_758290 [Exidia glandulosa HHB12029]|uniref:Sjogrens syndrome scleroderma autoantigen 1 n=1 Tax=Exidia glandulosa HHB12029 TaxID=1314781 RepID=A0A166BTT8_EXIGL|nr:hypothetical protein EXIGLDRAFT_758290 [Exidia glandulosa HHB12029]